MDDDNLRHVSEVWSDHFVLSKARRERWKALANRGKRGESNPANSLLTWCYRGKTPPILQAWSTLVVLDHWPWRLSSRVIKAATHGAWSDQWEIGRSA